MLYRGIRRFDAAIVAAWFDLSLTRREIAHRIGVAEYRVADVWRREARKGCLPVGRRPSGEDVADHCAVSFEFNAPHLTDEQLARMPDPDDGSALWNPDSDPLLDALKRAHGNDPRRAFDNVEEAHA